MTEISSIMPSETAASMQELLSQVQTIALYCCWLREQLSRCKKRKDYDSIIQVCY